MGRGVTSIEHSTHGLRVAVAGAGAIARVLIAGIACGDAGNARVVAIGGQPGEAAALEIARRYSIRVVDDLSTLAEGASLVVEAAGPEVVRTYAALWLRQNVDVMTMSTGALVDRALRDELVSVAVSSGRRILVPSGAIAGIDGIRAGVLGGLRKVTLKTTKPPRGLADAPYVISRGINVGAFSEATTIFEGTVAEAIAGFPSNVNVSAVLSLASATTEVQVTVVADPQSDLNRHEIEAEGEFGRFTVRLDNVPSRANPKTSAIAPLSALAMLRRLSEPLLVGA